MTQQVVSEVVSDAIDRRHAAESAAAEVLEEILVSQVLVDKAEEQCMPYTQETCQHFEISESVS